MKHSEVLSRYVNTGKEIPKEQYDRLTPSLKKSYLRMRGVAGNYFEWEFKIISDDERIKFIEKKGEELDKYGFNDSFPLIMYSDNKDKIITKIIEIKGEKLNDNHIKKLLYYSVNKDLIATKIIEIKGEKLNDDNINLLLDYSENKDLITTKIINAKGEKLDNDNISNLLDYSNDKDLIITKIINAKGEKLDSNNIHLILYYSVNKDDITTKIINQKGKKLNNGDIINLLHFSDNKELIKKLFLQKGIDHNLINEIISKNGLNIPLIPDNYQSMLNEIRRIKEIMK